jgi:polar amino acid transport system substrate-binding protein
MKLIHVTGFLLGMLSVNAWAGEPTEQDAIKLVNDTVASLKSKAPETIGKINAGEAPFKDAKNAGFYVFVYDHELNMIAHPDKALVGRNLKGKADACGCLFRDEILNRVKGTSVPTKCAASKDKAWVDYVYKNPEKKTLEQKKTYYVNAKGSDGKEYIVLSGIYVAPMKECAK